MPPPNKHINPNNQNSTGETKVQKPAETKSNDQAQNPADDMDKNTTNSAEQKPTSPEQPPAPSTPNEGPQATVKTNKNNEEQKDKEELQSSSPTDGQKKPKIPDILAPNITANFDMEKWIEEVIKQLARFIEIMYALGDLDEWKEKQKNEDNLNNTDTSNDPSVSSGDDSVGNQPSPSLASEGEAAEDTPSPSLGTAQSITDFAIKAAQGSAPVTNASDKYETQGENGTLNITVSKGKGKLDVPSPPITLQHDATQAKAAPIAKPTSSHTAKEQEKQQQNQQVKIDQPSSPSSPSPSPSLGSGP